MLGRRRIKLALAAFVLAASVPAVSGVASAEHRPTTSSASGRYGRAELQRDLDAIHDTGVSGVLAEVDIGRRRLRGTSGVADLTTGKPVRTDSYFRMGSNTKTFVATVVLQLVHEDELSLDDTVERWLPGVVTGNGNDGRAITVRQLLQHTSGLHNYTDDLAARITSPEAYRELQFTSFTPEELVDMAMAHAPDFAPGEGWNYSNTNYILLGMIIKKATGNDWGKEVHNRIVRPLRLRHTFAPGNRTELPSPHTSAYLYLDRDTPLETSAANMSWADAAGALVTDSADLSRFWKAIGDGTLLHRAEQKEMRSTVLATTFQEDQPGVRYGLGLGWTPLSCGGGYWGHDGDVPGYSTVSGVSANGRTTVVISISVTADTTVHQAAWKMVDNVMCNGR
jgi:D-alanyl-D-alanine carboxypeptidase